MRKAMKARWIRFGLPLGVLFLGLFWTSAARAQGMDYPMPMPYPSPPPFYRFSFGFQTELSSREIVENEFVFNGANFVQTKGSADMVRLLARFGVSLMDNFEIYGVVGGSNLSIDEFDRFNSGEKLAYGGGLHWVYYQIPTYGGSVDLFIDYRILRFRSKDQVIFDPFVTQALVNETIVWNEHRVKLGVSGRHDFFEPYGGVRLSIVRGKDYIPIRNPPSNPGLVQDLNLRFEENNLFGLFFGTNIFFDPSEKAFFFIEGNVIDEDALNLGIRVRF
jgi:hypothetical protein